MAAALQVGGLAALVVLFVPMGMAGWHLSRNKMLFFGGALFITLAIGVHLAPYFPSFPDLLLPPPGVSTAGGSSGILQPKSPSCLSSLNEIIWSGNLTIPRPWTWSQSVSLSCGFGRLGGRDAADLLNGSWILVAGDSQARLLVLSLLSLLLDPTAMEAARADLFKRHSDYHISVPDNGADVDFLWAPYASNLSTVLRDLHLGSRYPDVVAIGAGLWDMLHVTNLSEYAESLSSVRRWSVAAAARLPLPHMFWLGMPTLVYTMLNTAEKKAKMNHTVWEAYRREVRVSGLLRRDGGPLFLTNMARLSSGCGSQCTEDGMHYSDEVYEAALQVMLNALLFESHQRIL